MRSPSVRGVVIAVLLAGAVAGCGTSSLPVATSTPSPLVTQTPSPPPPATGHAVVVTGDGLAGGHTVGATYSVTLMGGSGPDRVVSAQGWSYAPTFNAAVAAGRDIPVWPSPLPRVSASSDRVYYIDGDTTLRWVTSDNRHGTVPLSLPGNAHTQVTVAVSPDDSRVAIGTVTYTVDARGYDDYPIQVRVRLQGISTGTSAHLFDYTVGRPGRPYVEWPVGWIHDNLVVGLAIPAIFQGQDGAVSPVDELLVDASTGKRLVDLCPSLGPPGLLDPFRLVTRGAVCDEFVNGGPAHPVLVGWDGTRTPVPLGSCPLVAAVAPNADQFVIEGRPQSGLLPCSAAGHMTLLRVDGTTKTLPYDGQPVGWVDTSRVLYHAFGSSPTAGPSAMMSIVDTGAGTQIDTGVTGQVEAYYPAVG
jgi:hypothetical protein